MISEDITESEYCHSLLIRVIGGFLSFSYRRMIFPALSPKQSHLIIVSFLGTVINLGFMIPPLVHHFNNITHHKPETTASTFSLMFLLWMSILIAP